MRSRVARRRGVDRRADRARRRSVAGERAHRVRLLHAEPVSIDTVDDRTFTVTFDPPLAGGEVGLRWSVQAADAHPIEGAFSFTVTAPTTTNPVTTSATTSPPAVPTTTSPAATIAADTATEDESAVEAPPTTTAAVATPPGSVPPVDAAGDPVDDAGANEETQSLEEFLAVDDSTPGETTLTVGRLVGFLGVALGLGAFAFVGTAMRGRQQEVRRLLVGVRALGVVIALGAAIEYVGVARVVAGAIMAFIVLDSFGELTGTPWGKIALEADPESPELLAELRSTVTAEAIMLVFVVSVTAWLVASAS